MPVDVEQASISLTVQPGTKVHIEPFVFHSLPAFLDLKM